jgi:PAS domain S-box-containing protein
VNVPFEFSKFFRSARQKVANPGALWRYGIAVPAVLAATVVRLAFNPVLAVQAPHGLFALAVIVAARFGGRGPGVAATVLAALSVDWFFLKPFHSLAIANPEDIWGLALFLVTGVLIALLVGSLRELLLARARAEEALQGQAQLIDLSHDAVITMDSRRRIITWNTGAEEMYGWPERDAVGKGLHQLLQTVSHISLAQIDEILHREGRWEGELSYTGRDGRRLVVDSRQVLIGDGNGFSARILAISRNITERKKTEEALRASDDALRKSHREVLARATELQAIMDAMPVALFISRDRECRNIIGNHRAYELLRLAVGSNIAESVPGRGYPTNRRVFKDGKELSASDLPLLKAAATGQSVRDYELELRFDDGKSHYIIGNAVPFLDPEGRSRGSVAIFVDITERKQNEERLRQTQKLESIGLLASGIAHDFNNLLTVIIGNANFALNKDPLSKEIQHIIAASELAAHLTRQLLAYAGKSQFFTRTFNLSDLVSRSTELLSASVSKRVKVGFHLSHEELFIKADPSQVEQVFMNLVINAGEAVPPHTDGQIEIATSTQEVTPEIVDEHALAFNPVPGRFACLEVIDNGCGMDETTLARIFDPFFSTKFSGRGLGLAAVQGIVRSCGGFIDVHSSPGVGSTFRVFLPLAVEKPAAEIPAVVRSGSPRRHRYAAILVVDDEELVRSMACTTLRSQGYEVLEAKDGKDALEVLAGAAELPSLVLVDLTMPVMGGDELVPVLNRDYPRLRIIVTSGYAEAEVQRGFPAGSVAGFLQKPYTVVKLAEKVADALDNGGPNEDTPAAA